MTNPDVVIKTVELKTELKTLLTKAELRVILNLIVLSLRQDSLFIYTGGNHEWLSNISGICKQLLIMSQRNIPESSISEKHDESDDKSEENE